MAAYGSSGLLSVGGAHRADLVVPLWRETCVHSGPRFPEPYQSLGLVLYPRRRAERGKAVRLEPAAEEIAVLFARLVVRGARVTACPTFLRHFDEDWRALVGRETPASGWDWTRLFRDDERAKREKEAEEAGRRGWKEEDEHARKSPSVSVAFIDGEEFPVVRATVDRPGIYVARSKQHPLHGRVRTRVGHQQVTLNLSRGAPVPPPGTWEEILHQPMVYWLARWRDPLTRDYKYMTIRSATLGARASYDALKFRLAARLGERMVEVRTRLRDIVRDARHPSRWVGVCAALIMEFGIRRGGETDSLAVGATTLRARHVRLRDKRIVRLRFRGKDDVLFDASRTVDPDLYDALTQRLRAIGEGERDRLWDVSPRAVNDLLNRLLPGLTSKAVRTQRATALVRRRLESVSVAGAGVKEHVDASLLEAAEELNHRRAGAGGDARDPDDEKEFEASLASFRAATRRFWAATHEGEPRTRQSAWSELKRVAAFRRLAPSTCKMNYVDPTVIRDFAARHAIPLERVFTPAQRATLLPHKTVPLA